PGLDVEARGAERAQRRLHLARRRRRQVIRGRRRDDDEVELLARDARRRESPFRSTRRQRRRALVGTCDPPLADARAPNDPLLGDTGESSRFHVVQHGRRQVASGPHDHRQPFYLTRFVRRRRKSRMTYCPSVIVVVKYALPRASSHTRATNWTSAGSRASMNVLMTIPALRHAVTSLNVSRRIRGCRPMGFL